MSTGALTGQRRQDASVGARLLWILRGVFGLKDLVEVQKLPVPPVDQILAPSFRLHLNYKLLRGRKGHLKLLRSIKSTFFFFEEKTKTYKVVDETFLLLNVGDDGADRDIIRQLIKVTGKR